MARVVIVGGGVAGLSAGIYCLLDGHSVTVCEQHGDAGGNLTGWQRGEYHIDNCIHWLTGTNRATDTYKMWRDLGALSEGVEIIKNDTLYTCEYRGKRLSLCRDLYKMKRDMLSLAPEDKREIESLIRAVESVAGLCGIAGEQKNKGLSPSRKFTVAPTLLKYWSLTTGELAARFSNKLMRYFLTAMMGDDFGSLALITVFATFCFDNGDLVRGGSFAMAQRMKERFLSLGGELILGQAVTRVDIKDGAASSVKLLDGKSILSDYVILTADPAAVFGKIIDAPMPKQLQKLYDSPRLYRFSSYHCAFACDVEQLPFKGDLMFPISNRYRAILRTDSLIVREFSHEPSYAPKGKNIIQSLTFCNESDARAFIRLRAENREAYKRKKQRLASCIEELLVSRFPEMAGKLRCIDVWTPATYRRFTHSEMGTYMSFAMPSYLVPTRKSNRIAGLENVLLATQWQQLPGGLPTAADTGRAAAATVRSLEKRRSNAKDTQVSHAYAK